ncbi:hypothetical protein NP493_47g01018 [Ridgeia piscesae]|uniref:Uncharacterized protein n=1 Tax=Ridgeia piscesae TaxID=27915 RepID=A0AAD9PBQ7_RIDPI|nr:hypothetical protein NP493_47g01018 [Ridgeia piscesae]
MIPNGNVTPTYKMASQDVSRTRALGMMRHSSIDALFPPLGSTTHRENRNVLHAHGSAMSVAPARLAVDRCERPKMVKARRTPTSVTPTSTSTNKELQEKIKELKAALAREKLQQEEVASLQTLLDEQKKLIAEKEGEISEMKLKLQEQESHYKALYEKECTAHAETRVQLNTTQQQLSEKLQYITELATRHNTQLQQLESTHSRQQAELQAKLESQIAIRDGKLNKLKKQMADALMGNSWERQQQLDELTKELTRAQEEADMLRIKIRSMLKAQKTGTGASCANCESLTSQLQDKKRILSMKDQRIRDLENAVRKTQKK